MYYCDECGETLGWPIEREKHRGPCEICGNPKIDCNKGNLQKLEMHKGRFMEIMPWTKEDEENETGQDSQNG